jgi:glutathione-regulated potassium-efflux system ancillary protein KefC
VTPIGGAEGIRTAGFSIAALLFLPWVTAQFFKRYGSRPSELESKYLLLLLFGLGDLATCADSELVLPAYLIGMILAGSVGKDHILIRRLRTLCLGFLRRFIAFVLARLCRLPPLLRPPLHFC